MTNFDVLTRLWIWRSPAWLVALAATVVYLAIARQRRASFRRIAFFAASLAAYLIALTSPVATLATRYLFSAHMAQHLLLLLIVPLFAILAWPRPDVQVANVNTRRRHPGAIQLRWLAGVGAMWFWHVPALCTASMRSSVVLDIQIVSLIAAGAVFWWPVFSPNPDRRMPPHLAATYLFSGCVGCTLLGIYVTFSPVSVCPLYANPTGSTELLNLIRQQWGFSSRVDQQVGGLLMWVPACMVYLGAIMATLASWYQTPKSASNSLAME